MVENGDEARYERIMGELDALIEMYRQTGYRGAIMGVRQAMAVIQEQWDPATVDAE